MPQRPAFYWAMQRFPGIHVYERAFRLGIALFRFCKLLPKEETYGIGAQLRRAALSIFTNIAEGSKAASNFDYANFLNISEKSTAETQSLLRFCKALEYCSSANYPWLFSEASGVAKMLHSLRMTVLEQAKRDQEEERRMKRKKRREDNPFDA